MDKVSVITGASSGIGEKLAEVAIARGARVVLAARRTEQLVAVASRLGPNALAVTTDVSRRDDNDRLRDRTLERFGQIDVWVANAGRGISRPVSQLTDVDDRDVGRRDSLEGCTAIVNDDRLVTHEAQHLTQDRRGIDIVIDDQHAQRLGLRA